MKHIFLSIIIMLLSFTFGGCTSKTTEKQKEENNKNPVLVVNPKKTGGLYGDGKFSSQPIEFDSYDGKMKYLLSSDCISFAYFTTMQKGDTTEIKDPSIKFTLNSEGKRRLKELTRKNLKRPIYLVLQGKVISCPVVGTVIEDGTFTIYLPSGNQDIIINYLK